jgi:hypothetical protein
LVPARACLSARVDQPKCMLGETAARRPLFFWQCPLLERTCVAALHEFASDLKRTSVAPFSSIVLNEYDALNSKNDGGRREPQVGQFDRRFDSSQPFFVLSVDFSAGYDGILHFRDSARDRAGDHGPD